MSDNEIVRGAGLSTQDEVHADLKKIVNGTVDSTKTSRLYHLMVFRKSQATNAYKLHLELGRIFARGQDIDVIPDAESIENLYFMAETMTRHLGRMLELDENRGVGESSIDVQVCVHATGRHSLWDKRRIHLDVERTRYVSRVLAKSVGERGARSRK